MARLIKRGDKGTLPRQSMFPFFNDGVDGLEPLEYRLLGTSVLENSRGWNQVNLYDMHVIKDFPHPYSILLLSKTLSLPHYYKVVKRFSATLF